MSPAARADASDIALITLEPGDVLLEADVHPNTEITLWSARRSLRHTRPNCPRLRAARRRQVEGPAFVMRHVVAARSLTMLTLERTRDDWQPAACVACTGPDVLAWLLHQGAAFADGTRSLRVALGCRHRHVTHTRCSDCQTMAALAVRYARPHTVLPDGAVMIELTVPADFRATLALAYALYEIPEDVPTLTGEHLTIAWGLRVPAVGVFPRRSTDGRTQMTRAAARAPGIERIAHPAYSHRFVAAHHLDFAAATCITA